MRARLLAAIGIVLTAPLLSLLAPAPAHADTCYYVWTGIQWARICYPG